MYVCMLSSEAIDAMSIATMVGRRRSMLSLALLFFVFRCATSSEADTLLSFKAAISDPDGSLRSWSGSSPCSGARAWRGVVCNPAGQVKTLQLEGMGLSGRLDLDVLTELPMLRSVSFSNNSFEGPMPNLKVLEGLKMVYLKMNRFGGKIPDDAFGGMRSLKEIDLSWNGFTGPIPSSLLGSDKLLKVRIGNNGFDGQIPGFPVPEPGLSVFDVSNNKLEGRIPEVLNKLDPSMFADNTGLCGAPLTIQCKLETPAPSKPPPSSKKQGLNSSVIVAIVVISIGVVLAVLASAFAMIRRKNQNDRKGREGKPLPLQKPKSPRTAAGTRSQVEYGELEGAVGRKKGSVAAVKEESDHGRLHFVRADRERFELHDLLRASAEILGSGEFGSSYKATLLNGPSVVAKRFKEMNGLGKEEFHEHMRRLGRLSHPNLLPLVAYYYKKEEKLLITDYIPYGSLASLLHGNRTPNNPNLDWSTRLKIVKGIARGLWYLYKELSAVTSAPHGHLKSSNVLLDDSQEPLLTDYGLASATNQARATKTMIAYKSPEYKQSGRLSKKSDVWSFGVLVLEILTGKFPGNYSRQGHGGSDLANWVNSVVREEWTGEVFDGEMRRTRNSEGDMLRLLQIGLGCCEVDPSKRWELEYALEQIEELKERGDADDDGYSFLSEGDVYSRAISEDDFSFSTNK